MNADQRAYYDAMRRSQEASLRRSHESQQQSYQVRIAKLLSPISWLLRHPIQPFRAGPVLPAIKHILTRNLTQARMLIEVLVKVKKVGVLVDRRTACELREGQVSLGRWSFEK